MTAGADCAGAAWRMEAARVKAGQGKGGGRKRGMSETGDSGDTDTGAGGGALCGVAGCLGVAEYGVAMAVPAQGMPLAEHEPLIMQLELEVCESCMRGMKPRQALSEEGWAEVEVALVRNGWARPDPDRAQMMGVRLDSPERRQYREMMAKAGACERVRRPYEVEGRSQEELARIAERRPDMRREVEAVMRGWKPMAMNPTS